MTFIISKFIYSYRTHIWNSKYILSILLCSGDVEMMKNYPSSQEAQMLEALPRYSFTHAILNVQSIYPFFIIL